MSRRPLWPNGILRTLKRTVGRFILAGLICTQVSDAYGTDGVLTVPVPIAAMAPGHVVQDGDLTEKKYGSGIANSQVHLKSSDLVGKVVRRMLLPGRPIPLIAVKEAELVAPGQIVELVYAVDGLEIRSRAVALQPGRIGEAISARNIDSGRQVHGVVESHGVIRVGG